jgi:hypothetical protein
MHKALAGLILIIIMLLSINAIPNGSSGLASSSAVTTIRATVLPYIEVSAPDDICIWELQPSEPGIYTKKGVIKVTANTAWKVMAISTDEANNGYMIEWTETSYANKKLQSPLKVSADREVTLPEGGIIQTGTTLGEQDIEVTLTQAVSQEDLPLENGHVYRIALSFEGSPME